VTNDPMDFARMAAELDGDATVRAGTSRPTFMMRIAAFGANADSASIPTSQGDGSPTENGEPRATAAAVSLRTQLEKEAP